MEGCGMNFIKYLLFVFNTVFAISGLGIIVAGGLVLSDVADFRHFTTSDLYGPPIVLIVTGSIVFIVALLGCFGAIRESPRLLLAFAGLLGVILVLELAAGVAAARYRNEFEGGLKSTLRHSLANYTTDGNNLERVAWDKIQKKLMCCGIDGPNDWQLLSTKPSSCCYQPGQGAPPALGIEDTNCQKIGVGSYVYKNGCYGQMRQKILSNTKVLTGVGIGIAFVEVIGIVLATLLAKRIRKESEGKN